MTAIEEILGPHGLRTTRPRRTVFAALAQASEPSTLAAILSATPTADRVSVYRTLNLFVRLGIVTVVHVGWKKRYELAGEYQAHHHHHLVCTSCGRIDELSSNELEGVIAGLSSAHGFTPSGHTFEITGLCNACA